MNRRAFLTSTGVAATVAALPSGRSSAKNDDGMKRPMLSEKLGSRKGLPDLAPAPRRVLAGLEPYVPTPQQPWDRRRVEYLLRRTMFGAKRDQVTMALGKTPGEIVDMLLADQTMPTAPAWVTELPNYDSVNQQADQTRDIGRVQEFQRWWISLMLSNTITMREKMVLFWHDHFATEYDKVRIPQYQFLLNDLFHQYAFGDFKELVKKVTIDLCMLFYLDGIYSTKARPNENYGRELQELFTLGIYDSTGKANYTEADIQNVARALTGWYVRSTVNGTVRTYELSSYLDNARHDSTNKTFQGQTGNFGLDEILNIIFQLPACAEFICRKLYREFVYEIADETIVQQLATIFRNSNYNIKPVLSALFKSAHFFDDANIGSHIVNPMEFIVGIYRSLGVNVTSDIDLRQIFTWGAGLGMQLLDPPNVKGWPAYRSWISSSLLPARYGTSDAIVKKTIFDPVAYVKSFPKWEDAEVLVRDVTEHLITMKLSENQITMLVDKLLEGAPATDWPLIIANGTIAQRKIQELLKAIFRLGENQLS